MKKSVYKEIATELNIPEYLAEKVARHPLKMLEAVMNKGEFEGVLLKHLGRFVVKPGRIKFLNKDRDAKASRVQSNITEGSEDISGTDEVELEVSI